jgi:hypothetical protein
LAVKLFKHCTSFSTKSHILGFLTVLMFSLQLYHYGFERCEQGAFSHPLFQRDNESLSWSMVRKVMRDNESLKLRPSSCTKRKPHLSSKKEHRSVTTMSQEQELRIPRIFCSSIVSLPSTTPNIYDSLVPRAVVSNTQDAINTATELSVLLMEPRTIEQMNADPVVVDEFFGLDFGTPKFQASQYEKNDTGESAMP